jgi:hypothetical protein
VDVEQNSLIIKLGKLGLRCEYLEPNWAENSFYEELFAATSLQKD